MGRINSWRLMRPWRAELAWTLVSICFLVATMAVLIACDGKSEPVLPWGVSINVVVSIFTTACKASFAFPILEGLSQMKWNWLSEGHPRPLDDMRAYDQASRGAYGCLGLLRRARGGYRFLVIISTFILTTSIATEALMQSAVSYSLRLTQIDSSVLGNNLPELMTSGTFYGRTNYPENDARFEEKIGIQQGIYASAQERLQPLDAFCSTGTCLWRGVETLAVCATIRNVTDKLDISNITLNASGLQRLFSTQSSPASEDLIQEALSSKIFQASLPNGSYLIGGRKSIRLNISAPISLQQSDWRRDIMLGGETDLTLSSSADSDLLRSALFAINIILYNSDYPDNGTMSGFRASEVLFHFCVNTYDASVTNGTLKPVLVSTDTIVNSINETNPQVPMEYGYHTNVTSMLTNSDPAHSYLIPQFVFKGLFYYMRETLLGTYGPSTERIQGQTVTSEAFGKGLACPSLQYNIQQSDKCLEQRLANITTNIANGLSKAMVGFVTSSLLSTRYEIENAVGEVFEPRSYVTVNWAGALILVLQVFLSTVFIAGVVRQTHSGGVAVLKSDLFPVLLAVDPGQKALLIEAYDSEPCIAHVYKNARAVAGALRNNGKGWVLSSTEREHK
ncbi:hypothetical protein F5Y15DRAFT_370761 [Xylariaceae sp. FL0016]|nr:hypothetical protein F5Y15DRAFT_370761 [Xylariaceae sp. FL0016]